ncbi:MAG TPA: hypothetical protein VFN22_12240 [Gemmatimonadales bacterium]|nr:hypothetical protein [Gemmatimonadales bacterium]
MLEVRHVTEHDLRGERGPQLLRYLLECGADEFSITVMAMQDTPAPFVDAFEDEFEPYARPAAVRRVIGTAETMGEARTVRLWTLDDASLTRLLSFVDTGLFHWPAGPDGWFEDLLVYRRGDLVLGLASDERAGLLCLTPQEHAAVAALGIASSPKR